MDLLAEGQRVLESENFEDREHSEKLKEYLDKVDDIKKSDLAAYVSRRKVILDLLAKAIIANEDGKYAREDVIHSLIMPMRVTSDEAPPTLRAICGSLTKGLLSIIILPLTSL